jgi:hypothetical protein
VRRHEAGFSLLELMVAMALMMVITSAIFTALNPSQGAFSVEPEVADMQQRLRVASDTLYKDLVMAGGGAYQGSKPGSLGFFFASVLPYRRGNLNPDPVGTFKADTITLIYVPATQSQTSICVTMKNNDPCGMPGPSAELKTLGEAGCPLLPNGQVDDLCTFQQGMNALIYDDTGSYELFTITQVQNEAGVGGHIQHNLDTFSKAYGPGSKIVQMTSHTYYLRSDDQTGTYQLMHYDGSRNPDVPVVDNVVGLSFEYWGEPQPPTRTAAPLTDPAGPWTTYGPKPPSALEQPTAYPRGENCTFSLDPVTGLHVPRLANLSAAGNPNALVRLTAAQLTDGPWCPDAANANRWDADLLRIRKVAVTLRVQSAVAALRGPAGPLFAHGGTSSGGTKMAPDQEVRFQVTPRNLNLGR